MTSIEIDLQRAKQKKVDATFFSFGGFFYPAAIQ
jgi:hypothetical protein